MARQTQQNLYVETLPVEMARTDHKAEDNKLRIEDRAALICRSVAAQFMEDSIIALFEFAKSDSGVGIVTEKHYRLVPPEQVTEADLSSYRQCVTE